MQQNGQTDFFMDVPTWILQSILDVILQLGHGTCHEPAQGVAQKNLARKRF